MAAVNKANKQTHSSIKVDFEKGEPTKEGLRQKKAAFSDREDNIIRKGISKYGYGRWTSILNDSSFKFHPLRKPRTLVVRAKKYDSATNDNFGNFTIMSQIISLISFLNWHFWDMIGFIGKLGHFNNVFAIFITG